MDSVNSDYNQKTNNLKSILLEYAELYRNGKLREILYAYLDEGIDWHLFPVCWFDENGNCACGYRDKQGNPHLDNNIGKAPFLPHGMKDATMTKPGVDDFLKRYPKANWAGYFPGQFILDIDVRHNGYAGLAKLEKEHGKLPKTRTHITGSGGRHIIYKLPQGINLSASNLKGYKGIDIKINGYIVLPPSSHISGGFYHVR